METEVAQMILDSYLIEESISQSSAFALKLPCRQFTTDLIKIRHVRVLLQVNFAYLICLILSVWSFCTEADAKRLTSFCALFWAFLASPFPLNALSFTTLLLHCCLHLLLLSEQGTSGQLYNLPGDCVTLVRTKVSIDWERRVSPSSLPLLSHSLCCHSAWWDLGSSAASLHIQEARTESSMLFKFCLGTWSVWPQTGNA